MTSIDVLRSYLPPEWLAALARVSAVPQEIRLRADSPVTVSLPTGDRFLTRSGLSSVRQPDAFYCSRHRLEACFLAFCGHSVYAHQWELTQGYIAVEGGIRVGVAGTAVLVDGAVTSVQNVTGLCIRLPRRVADCARSLLPLMVEGNRPVSTLLVGPPASGKTTLLRDLAALLAAERHPVAVVDERGELSLEDTLDGCDVLRGYPKAVGVRQAVRCLAPRVVLLDELGDGAEVDAVADCAHTGVAVVATLHGYDPWEMARQPFVQSLIHRRIFPRWVFLQGREHPGRIRECYIPEVTADGISWRSLDGGGRDRDGAVCVSSSAAACGVFGDLRTAVAGLGAGDELYTSADFRAVAAAGLV